MGKVGMALDATALQGSKRLAALHAYDILDTLPEPAFDRLAKLAAQICGTPYAAITVVVCEQTFYKSKIGFVEGDDLVFWDIAIMASCTPIFSLCRMRHRVNDLLGGFKFQVHQVNDDRIGRDPVRHRRRERWVLGGRSRVRVVCGYIAGR